MDKQKNNFWKMRVKQDDKSNIIRLARRLRVSESDAVRLAVSEMLRSGKLPHVPAYMRRPIVIRRKVTE